MKNFFERKSDWLMKKNKSLTSLFSAIRAIRSWLLFFKELHEQFAHSRSF